MRTRIFARAWEIMRGPNPSKRIASRLLWASQLSRFITFQSNSINYRFFPSSMSAEMWVNPRYLSNEIQLTKSLIKISKGDLKYCIDVGANIGVFSLNLARILPSGQIFAIEPHPKIYKYLAANVNMNSGSIKTLNLAVGARDMKAQISNKRADDMNQVYLDDLKSGRPISVSKLDTLFEELSIFVLKVDVEGMERDVLLGAKKLLSRTQNVIVEVDAENYKAYGIEVSEVLDFLTGEKFTLVGVSNTNNGSLRLVYPLILSGERGENILATRLNNDQISKLLEIENH